MFRIGLSLFTIWTVRGDRATLNNGKDGLKDREICSQRLRFTAM